MANLLLLLAVVLLLGLAVYLLWKDRQMTRMEQMRIQKLRGSELYARIYPTLRHLNKRDIESVRIRPQDLCITLMSQPGKGFRFDFIQMGYRPLTADQVTSMALSLERDIGVLAESERYRMKRENVMQVNGTRAIQYSYVVRHQYKERISRAPYYQKAA